MSARNCVAAGFSYHPDVGHLAGICGFFTQTRNLCSEFVGLDNFRYLFGLKDTWQVVSNTFFIAICKVALNLTVPLIFALLLNEVRNKRYKKAVQTVVYLPHFISWVILAGIVSKIFSYSGIVNQVVEALGGERAVFLQNASFFRKLIIFSDTWKEYGFNAIIYLAALTNISPALYEAAAIDGANRWNSMRRITLPSLSSTVILLGTLSLGNVLNAGFDQSSTCITRWCIPRAISSIHGCIALD